MFTPCEVYCDKKAKKSGDVDRDSVKSGYFKLNEKKAMKFIKKAEAKYDSYVAENPEEILPPFSDYLSRKEQVQLFRSYGMPEKPAVCVNKFILDYI
jgi:hypothetical protein